MLSPVPAAFLNSALADPLFAAEGMDVERAEKALDSIEESLGGIEHTLGLFSWRRKLFFMRYPLGKYMFPLSFLRSFIESERRRRVFITDPTMETAQKLLQQWHAAAHAYTTSVSRYEALHHQVFRNEPKLLTKEIYDVAGNIFSAGDVQTMLALFAKNAEALQKEAALRSVFLYTKDALYEQPDIPAASVQSCMPPPLSESAKRFFGIVDERTKEQFNVLEKHGPIGYRLSHIDGAPTDHQFFAYVLQNRTTGQMHVRIELADRYYFLPLDPDNLRYGAIGQEIFQPLIEKKIPYWMQTVTRFYAMRDQQYWMDITSIVDRARRPELDWNLAGCQKSSLLDLVLTNGAGEVREQMLQTKARLHTGGVAGYSLGRALFLHSAPSIYFLPFNSSVWRLSEKVDFLGGRRYEEDKGIYESLEKVVPELEDDTLRAIVRGGLLRQQVWKEKGWI